MSIELTKLVCACRAKMMGFNAARLEWNVAGLAASPKSVSTSDCDIATAADIESSFTMTGDLSEGTDSIAHDWDTSMYR